MQLLKKYKIYKEKRVRERKINSGTMKKVSQEYRTKTSVPSFLLKTYEMLDVNQHCGDAPGPLRAPDALLLAGPAPRSDHPPILLFPS